MTPADMSAMATAIPTLQRGGWTHAVPLEIPPGPAGSAPAVSLLADFHVRDGPVGNGWALGGFSRIELRSDTGGVPHLDGTDVPYLDGMRLWFVLGELLATYTDFSTGSPPGIGYFTGDIWAPEMDDGRLLDFADETNTWRMRRDGWTWTYGEVVADGVGEGATEWRGETGAFTATCALGGSAPQACADETTAWLLSRVEDPNGNLATYSYSTTGLDEAGAPLPPPLMTGGSDPVVSGDYAYQHLPDTIVYANAHNEVRFVWEARDDVLVDARSGRPRVLAARLRAVETTGGGDVFSRYEALWMPDELTSRLDRIDRGGTDDARRTVRVSETNEDLSEWADGGWTIGGEGIVTRGSFTTTAPWSTRHQAVNFDGDPSLDLVRVKTQCEFSPGVDRPDSCSGFEFGFQRTVGTALAGSAADPEVDLLDAAFPSGFFAGGGAYAMLDIDRDGDTDILTATADSVDAGQAYTLLPDGTVQAEDLLLALGEGDRMLRFGQFADVDADGFLDLVLPPVGELYDAATAGGFSNDVTVWIRNRGAPPWLDLADAAELVIDFESPFSAFDDAVADCELEFPGAAPEPLVGAWDDYFQYTSATDYRAGQARWSDVNGDGVADVTYNLWSCWYDEPADSDGAYGVNAFSRVYLGDGSGSFIDSGFGAGEPYEPSRGGTACSSGGGCWPMMSAPASNALADLHRSGRTDLVEADPDPTVAGLFGYPFAGVATGFASADHALPPYSLFQANTSAGETSAYEWILGDFNGDGFTDFFDTAASTPTMYLNTRSTARHRVTTIEDAYGGEIGLTYTTSTLQGENPDLSWPVDVIESVSDQNGTTTYAFEGGVFWGAENRFLGFRDAMETRENGGTSNFRFGVRPWSDGRLIYQSDHRADGSLERFAYTSNRNLFGTSITLDHDPPYWNPPRRRCDAYVGPADGSGAQSVDEGDLMEQCDTEGGASTIPSWQQSAVYGWSGDDDAVLPEAPAWESWALDLGQLTLDGVGNIDPEGLWQPDTAYAGRDAYPPLSDDAAAGVVEPTDPFPPPREGTSTTLVTTTVQMWFYDAYHRVNSHRDLGSPSITADDVTSNLTFSTFDWNRVGEERIGEVLVASGGAPLRSYTYAPATNTFDAPEWTTETTGGGTRAWHTTYDNGEVVVSVDPDGVTETVTRNDCGQTLTRADGTGRTESVAWDATCRKASRTWEGATTTWTYDGFGRTTTEETAPHVGMAVEQRWHRTDGTGDIRNGSVWDAVQVFPDDAIHQSFLDEWGREVKAVDCESTGSWLSTSEDALDYGCDGLGMGAPDAVVTTHGYATDGSLRYASAAYGCSTVVYGLCDDAAATWTYADEQGRVEERLDPAPIDPVADPFAFVQTSTRYLPGDVRVTDPLGLACWVAYNPIDRSWWCDGDFRGGETRNALGLVVEAEDADGTVMETTYDDWWRPKLRRLAASQAVATITGTSRAETRWTWTDADREHTVTDDDGNTTAWTHDAAGRKTEEWYEPYGGAADRVWAWTRWNHGSAFGNSVMTTDIDGNVTGEVYDGMGRLLQRIYPDATAEGWVRNARGNVTAAMDRRAGTTTTQYDFIGRPVVVTDPLSNETSMAYDPSGRVIETSDADGVTTTTDFTWNGRVLATYRGGWTLAEYAYDDAGRVIDSTEDGVRTTATFDSLGRQTSECVGDNGVDCGIAREWTHTDTGLVATVAVGGNTTAYTYNRLGWLTLTVHPDASWASTTWDDLGQPARQVDEVGAETLRDFDGWRRLVEERRPGQTDRYFEYTRDVSGTHRSQVRETAPDGGEWTTQYDAFGRPVWSEDPFGVTKAYTYAGPDLAEIATSDPVGGVLAHEGYWWDGRGQMTMRAGPMDDATWSSLGSGTPDPSSVYGYAYTYTDGGRLLTREGPNDLTSWGYLDGEVETEDISGVTTVTWAYAPDARRLVSKTTAGGGDSRLESYGWNRGMRVSDIYYDDGGTPMEDLYANWDAYGRPRLATRWNGAAVESEYTLTTDSRGRVNTVAITANGTTVGALDYDWYGDGSLSRVGTTWAGSLNYNRVAGQLVTITDGTGINLATFGGWDDLGRAGTVALQGGRSINRSWGLDGQLDTMDVNNGVVTQYRSYGYDHRSRVTALATTRGLTTIDQDWTYAAEGWLESETTETDLGLGPTTETATWTYDLAGNRSTSTTSAGTSTYAYAYGNRLTSVDSAAVTWDGTGQMLDDHRGYSFLRNPDGSELGIDDTSGPVYTFTRDPYGRPIQSEDELGSLRTVIWGNPEADLPLAGIGALGVPELNVAADGLLLGRLEAGTFVPMASDPLGSTVLDGVLFTDPQGAFGEQAQTSSANRHVYAGLELLQGTPFQMARHRLYDSGVGRFTSMDPIRLGGGDHRFAYAENQPTGFSDPSGWSAWMGGAMGAGGPEGMGPAYAGRASGASVKGGTAGESRRTMAEKLGLHCDAVGRCQNWVTAGGREIDPARAAGHGYGKHAAFYRYAEVTTLEFEAVAEVKGVLRGRSSTPAPSPTDATDAPNDTSPGTPPATGSGTGQALPGEGAGGGGDLSSARTPWNGGTQPANSGFDIRAEVALSTGAGVFMSDVFSPAYARGAETVAGSPLGMLLGGASASQVGMAGGRFYLDGLLSGPMGLIDAGFVTYSGVRAVPQAVAAPYSNMAHTGAIWSGNSSDATAGWRTVASNYGAMASAAAAVFAVEGARIGGAASREGGQTIYRGVGTENAAYKAALEGRAPPTNPAANVPADWHSRGDYMWDGRGSQRTSWSTDRGVAARYAGPDGVVLETDAALWRTEAGDPDLFPGEFEVQVIGEVSGAKVGSP